MKEYETYENACNDQELDLRIIWKCNGCGDSREEPPGYNEGGQCSCGGEYCRTGESYNA